MRRTKWHLPRWYILTHSTCLINWSYAVSPRSGGNKLYTTRESPAPNVISGSASCCRCWERLSVDLIFLSVWVSVRHVTICVHFWKGARVYYKWFEVSVSLVKTRWLHIQSIQQIHTLFDGWPRVETKKLDCLSDFPQIDYSRVLNALQFTYGLPRNPRN